MKAILYRLYSIEQSKQTNPRPYLFPNMAQSSIKRQSITAFLLESNRNLLFQSLDCKNSINWPWWCVIFCKQRT